MRKRTLPESNYSAIYVDGATIRIPIDPRKEITELQWPEFYDVALNTKCKTGQTKLLQKDGTRQNCYYCYASASLSGEYFENVVQKIHKFFGPMTDNQRPTQWAIGGSGEPLEHPDFWKVCEAGRELGITPNYTTNGMLVTDDVVDRTIKICGGAAITCHHHMDKFWRRAVDRFVKGGALLNLHIIVSDKESITELSDIYKEFKDVVDYFVLLPYMNVGHAAMFPKKIDYSALELAVDEIYQDGKIAFGANFYNWITRTNNKYNASLYPPEIMSKYLVLDGEFPSVYNNSFEMKPVPFNPETGCELGHARIDFKIDQ